MATRRTRRAPRTREVSPARPGEVPRRARGDHAGRVRPHPAQRLKRDVRPTTYSVRPGTRRERSTGTSSPKGRAGDRDVPRPTAIGSARPWSPPVASAPTPLAGLEASIEPEPRGRLRRHRRLRHTVVLWSPEGRGHQEGYAAVQLAGLDSAAPAHWSRCCAKGRNRACSRSPSRRPTRSRSRPWWTRHMRTRLRHRGRPDPGPRGSQPHGGPVPPRPRRLSPQPAERTPDHAVDPAALVRGERAHRRTLNPTRRPGGGDDSRPPGKRAPSRSRP